MKRQLSAGVAARKAIEKRKRQARKLRELKTMYGDGKAPPLPEPGVFIDKQRVRALVTVELTLDEYAALGRYAQTFTHELRRKEGAHMRAFLIHELALAMMREWLVQRAAQEARLAQVPAALDPRVAS